jgi:hypothetical protein
MSPPTHIILESLHFRPASPAEKLICWKRNFSSWGGVLDINDYLGREIVNGSQLVTRDGQITYWVLSSLPSPPADNNVVEETIIAACETLKRPVLVKTRDGGVTEEHSYAIASVFTDPHRRRQGAATVLLKRLAEWLDCEGGCSFSALFSDVGKVGYPIVEVLRIWLINKAGILCNQRRLESIQLNANSNYHFAGGREWRYTHAEFG